LSEVNRGAAFGDIDNDGDVDVLVGTAAGPTRLLINNVGNKNHWLGLRLATPVPPRPQGVAPPGSKSPAPLDPKGPTPPGSKSSAPIRDALGARVYVMRKSGPALMRRARSDGSYASANDPRIVVGLGSSADPVSLRVVWPDGRTEEFANVTVDRWTTVVEGSAK